MPDTDDDKPTFEPLHPAFVGEADVLAYSAHAKRDLDGKRYRVNLTHNTCACPKGQAWEWHNTQERWVPFQYCSHKLRAMAEIVDLNERPMDMLWAYIKALASRYNKYEVVSAFHKELRRGAVEQAVFWGSVLMTSRGQKGVYKYLLNILYEETRDHTLGAHILERCIDKDKQSYEDLCRCIALFCRSKKKWELPHRITYLEGEMRGYAKLVNEFGRDVAKGGDIVSERFRNKLDASMFKGMADGDLTLFQYGLKGLQKSKTANIDKLRADICNRLLIQARKSDPQIGIAMEAFLARRASHGFGLGYHELNALGDLLTGEPYAPGCTTAEAIQRAYTDPAPPLRLGVTPVIPVYAQDNHTWAGKALIRRYPTEWLPKADQQHFDLRLCGAYIGVVWRHLAQKQFEDITCEWRSPDWPKWALVVQQLWY
jgi:hypothetical protein